MLDLFSKIFFVTVVSVVGGTNILQGKPSVMPSTWDVHASSRGNDGNVNLAAISLDDSRPYWQADLQGFFTVYNVTLSTGPSYAPYQRGAYVGLSRSDVSCPVSDVTVCGQWPDVTTPSTTLTFDCPVSSPARYVIIWREPVSLDNLALGEAAAEGMGTRLQSTVYGKHDTKKISSPSQTLTTFSVTTCSLLCHQSQPCVAFSYSHSLNICLLATDVTMTTVAGWETYEVSKCLA